MPVKLTQQGLVRKLKCIGLGDAFDLLHVPVEPRSMRNIGLAFVNFVDVASARKCMVDLPDGRLARGGRPLEVCAAHIQGLDANLTHYRSSVVGNSKLRQRRPLILIKGATPKLDEDAGFVDVNCDVQ